MSIYIKNNRNEELTQYKKLFTNSPQFVDSLGSIVTGIVDGSAYTAGLNVLSEGEHVFNDGTNNYNFIVYGNLAYWGAYYLREAIKDNVQGLTDNNIFLFPTINVPLKKFPCAWIYCTGFDNNILEQNGSDNSLYSREYAYKINLMLKVQNLEKSTEEMYNMIETITRILSSETNRQLGCFADDLVINSFVFNSLSDENIQLDNENTIYFTSSCDIILTKGEIFI
jgi:hypothetical protein